MFTSRSCYCISYGFRRRYVIRKRPRQGSILSNRGIVTSSFQAPEQEAPRSGERAKRIVLCRHGQSLGNVDDSAYVTTADWRIPLSDLGRQQAKDAGTRLSKLIGPEEKCFIYHSPYYRTTETMSAIVKELHENAVIGIREEPRIVEQQFGNFQNYEEVQESRDERVRFGRFFYRFPQGESGLDVYSRVTSFIATLFRDVQAMRDQQKQSMSQTNLVIVTHGLTLRLFLMRWLQISVEEFETMYNPDNGFLAVMERKQSECGNYQWYELTEESANHLRIQKRMADPLIKNLDNT